MQFLRILFFVFISIGFASPLLAQDAPVKRKGSRVIDDTTKQIYGPKTSRYFYEKDVFYNREVLNELDTFILNFHRFSFVQRYKNLYQDLGNIATSIRPIYYQTPEYIGATSGFNSFDLYWNNEAVKYYDTKSPYSNMKVILGGLGRSVTRVNFSRNITPRWNFGFNARWLLIDKQIQRTGKGDRNVKSIYYDLYTTYQSKDSTYRLFANFQRHRYQANEYGGVLHTDNELSQNLFFDNVQPSLTKARSGELRTNLHLYQQYKLIGKGFQLYDIFDSYNQENTFDDLTALEPADYFSYKNTHIGVKTDTVSDGATFKSLRNEVGIKGNLAKLFYNGYYAIRQYDMKYKYPGNLGVPGLNGLENYVGGKMELQLDSIGLVSGWAEFGDNTNFRVEGTIKSPWFEGSIKQLKYAPGFLMQAYEGAHNYWSSNLKSILTTQINGYLHYNTRILTLSPGFTFTRLDNYVFFRKDTLYSEGGYVQPSQSQGSQVIALPEIQFSLTMLRHITLTGQAIYSKIQKNDDDAISLPEFFLNGQLSYANIFFNGNMDMHGGVDVHWKSAYDALGYDPTIQQFYRDQSPEAIRTPVTPSFPIVDVFFNMKVKRGRIFLKYNNLVRAFTGKSYFATPFYPGQRNTIDFGFDLFFFD